MPLDIFLHDALAATFDYPRGARYHGAAGEHIVKSRLGMHRRFAAALHRRFAAKLHRGSRAATPCRGCSA